MEESSMNFAESDIKLFESLKFAGFNIPLKRGKLLFKSTLASLSFKIANEIKDILEVDNILEDDFIDEAAVAIGCSLLDPDNLYLYRIRDCDYEAGEPVYNSVNGYLLQVHSYLCHRQHLLTENEKIHFGHNISLLRKLCVCRDCNKKAA